MYISRIFLLITILFILEMLSTFINISRKNRIQNNVWNY